MPVAIVLGGAGSRGDFQVGALDFLRSRGIQPEIVCGASGGAVVGAKLAEGGDAVQQLRDIWLGLVDEQDFFAPAPWLADVEEDVRFLVRRSANVISARGLLELAIFPPLLIVTDALPLGIGIGHLAQAAAGALNARSIYTLDPLERRMRGHPLHWLPAGSQTDRARQICVGINGDSQMEVLAIGLDQRIRRNYWDRTSGGWIGWHAFGRDEDRGIHLSIAQSENIYQAFLVGTDRRAYYKYWDSGINDWGEWVNFGDPAITGIKIDVGRNGDNQFEILFLRENGSVWRNYWDLGVNDWTGWLPFGTPDSPARDLVIGQLDGGYEAFVVGQNRAVYRKYWNADVEDWSDWERFSDDNAARGLAVGRNGDRQLEVLIVGNDQHIYRRYYDIGAAAWTDWLAFGEETDAGSMITVGQRANGYEAFIIGVDRSVHRRYWDRRAGDWSAWTLLGDADDKSLGLTVTATATGLLYAFMIGTDYELWQAWQVTDVVWNLDSGGAVLDPARISGSGIRLRLSMVGLEHGRTHFITEDGSVLDANNERVHDGQADLISGVLASSSIPGIFPPVKLFDETYVDGGIRELVPVRAAIRLGASEIYIIYPSPGVVFDPAKPSYDRENLIGIATRSIDMMLDEVRLGDISVAAEAGIVTTMITASREIHDGMTIEPTLIRISMDYGYMRASDAIDGPRVDVGADALGGLTDQIVLLRKQVWNLEYDANGVRRPQDPSLLHQPAHFELQLVPDPDALREVRRLKIEIERLVRQRQAAGGALPAGFESWWRDWEYHPWETWTENPWRFFTSAAGDVEETDPPS